MARSAGPQPITIDKWKGLYARGAEDTIPNGYFRDCLNLRFDQQDCITRPGLDKVVTLANIRRMVMYKRVNETPRYIILTTSGSLYDSLYAGTPLITNALFTDFSAVNYANRLYITFHNRVTGITGTSVYVYEGAGPGTLRLAAGTAPSSFLMAAATSALSGYVEFGTHLFAVVFETSSGFFTAPGPEVFTVYDAPGGFAVDLSNLPIGPYGTVARWILATKVTAPEYDGNQYGWEMFFVPTGRVADNTSTTVSLSFFDADLQDSADYLFDNRSTIPAGVGITTYRDRLVVWGAAGAEHKVMISQPGQPEVFSTVDGDLLVDPSESGKGVRNCIEFRGSLYIAKNQFYVTQAIDNVGAASWGWTSVDKGVGAECFSISTIYDALGANTDRFFVADETALYVFESGVFRKPELSLNIEDLWKRINKVYFNKVQVVHDVERYLIYIAVPLDSATEISHIIVGDYQNAVSPLGFVVPSEVKWTIDGYPSTVSSILMDVNSSQQSVLKLAYLTGNIYQQNLANTYLDDGTKITSYVTTYLAQPAVGMVNHFTKLHLRIWGHGSLDIVLYSLDEVETTVIDDAITLSNAPGREYGYKINFVNEKMSVKIGTSDAAGDWFQIKQLQIIGLPLWQARVGE